MSIMRKTKKEIVDMLNYSETVVDEYWFNLLPVFQLLNITDLDLQNDFQSIEQKIFWRKHVISKIESMIKEIDDLKNNKPIMFEQI